MLFLILFIVPVALLSQTADLVVTADRIYTVDPARPIARAIAVRDGRILAVSDDVSRHTGSETRRIDAGGYAIIPGMIDCHAHMEGLGDSLQVLDLRAAGTVEVIAEMVRRAAVTSKPGEWIRGRSWDQTNWGGGFPSEAPLSEAAPNNPVYLARVDGHAAWVNRLALEIAGIGASTPDPPGGKILRTASGEPTGVLIDRAQGLVQARIPKPSASQVRDRVERAARECARLGLTTVHDAGIGVETLAAYRALIRDNRLPIRIYAMIGGEGPLWRDFLSRGPEIGERLTVRSIKLMSDGALGSRGAALLEPYSDEPGNPGLLMLSSEEIERVARQAVKHGFQVNTHAIGDRANRTVLDAYARVLGGANDKRFRVEHAQVVALKDFERFARYSVIASVQATHATSDMRWAEARLGPERVQGAYAWRRFLDAGAQLVNGSDFPVEDANPLWGFYAAITRQDHGGSPKGGWLPEQRLTREEALRSWTLEGAYAAFEEKSKGSLVTGKLADFVVLSRDILRVPAREVLSARVLMTVVGGEILYSELK